MRTVAAPMARTAFFVLEGFAGVAFVFCELKKAMLIYDLRYKIYDFLFRSFVFIRGTDVVSQI